MMHDLDTRFDNLDRIVDYLVKQLGLVEDKSNSNSQRAADKFERDAKELRRATTEHKN